ncbi:hypothetical protein ACOMHN_029978 [Nucella lapillus]
MNITLADQLRYARVSTLSLCTVLLIAHATALAHSGQPGQNVNNVNKKQREIREVIENGMVCKQIPGLAMAVVKDGKVVMSEGYGVKDQDTQQNVTADTQFLVASLSKAFTAALLTNAVSANRSMSRKMSTNVYRVLGRGFKFNNTLRSTYATLEDLVAHRTGIPRNNYVRLSAEYTIHRFASKIRYLPSKGGFRDSFYYNDFMYGLAAYITEKVNGDIPWKQQMRDTIFSKLGMGNSTFVDDVDFDRDDVATPYMREQGQIKRASVDFIKHWGRNLGSGNVMSSANDMAQWMLMLLNNGYDTQGRTVLRDGVVEQTFTAQNVLFLSSEYKYRKPAVPYSFTSDNYALGWRRGYYKGYQMMFHSGSSFGYRAYLTLLPEMDVGVVTLMTGSDYGYKFRKPLHMYLMDLALGQDPWIDNDTICRYPDAWESPAARKKRSAAAIHADDNLVDNEEEEYSAERHIHKRHAKRAAASFPLDDYVGTYHHAAYGTLHVRYNQTSQSLIMEYGIGLWQLHSAGGHEFDGEWLKDPPTISGIFKFKSSGGKVNALEAVRFEASSPPVFMKVSS